MNLQFALGDTVLDKSEVNSLLTATGQDATFHIDIAKHVDVKTLDAQKLFTLSVEKKDPALAALASKLAISGFKAKRSYNRNEANVISSTPVTPIKPEQLLEKMVTDKSLKNLGAAMILDALFEGPDPELTLREIATAQVNKLGASPQVSRMSDVFRGFQQKSTFYGWEPVTSTKVERSKRYHASPVYTALRDGLATLTKFGMVNVRETVSFGGHSGDNPSAAVLQRKVYEISLTSEGEDLADMWGDIESYIAHGWNKRMLNKLAA